VPIYRAEHVGRPRERCIDHRVIVRVFEYDRRAFRRSDGLGARSTSRMRNGDKTSTRTTLLDRAQEFFRGSRCLGVGTDENCRIKGLSSSTMMPNVVDRLIDGGINFRFRHALSWFGGLLDAGTQTTEDLGPCFASGGLFGNVALEHPDANALVFLEDSAH
jgi:hypothetical protein